MRGVSELVAFLVLMGAVTVVFTSALIIIPQYFQQYNRVAMQASQAVSLSGLRTEAVLVRQCSTTHCSLIILLYNSEADPTRVNYYVYCESSDGLRSQFVGREENVVVYGGSRHVKVYQNIPKSSIADMVCYLVVEEPNLLVYKVVET